MPKGTGYPKSTGGKGNGQIPKPTKAKKAPIVKMGQTEGKRYGQGAGKK